MANALKHLTVLNPLFNERLNIKDQHWLISLPILAHSQCRRRLRSNRYEAMLSRWANLCLGETLQNCWKPWHRTYATLSSCCEYFPEHEATSLLRLSSSDGSELYLERDKTKGEIPPRCFFSSLR